MSNFIVDKKGELIEARSEEDILRDIEEVERQHDMYIAYWRGVRASSFWFAGVVFLIIVVKYFTEK